MTVVVPVVPEAGQKPPSGSGPSEQRSCSVSTSVVVDGQVNVAYVLPFASVGVAPETTPEPESTDHTHVRPEHGPEAFPVSCVVLFGGCVLSTEGLATIVSHVAQQLEMPLMSKPPASWFGLSMHTNCTLTTVVARLATENGMPLSCPASVTPVPYEPWQVTWPSSETPDRVMV